MMKKILLALSLSGLVGCVSLLPDSGDRPPRLRLNADAPINTGSSPVDVGLVINDPSAESVFNSFNVAVATGPYQFEYIDGAEWSDRVPVLFRIYLERRFENAAVVTAVGDRTELSLGAAYTLYTDIRAFHIDRTNGPEAARVSFGARLTDRRGRTLGSQVFTKSIPTQVRGAVGYAEALNGAARVTTEEAVSWAAGLLTDEERRLAASVEVTGG